jgi:hypothetical protein
MDDEHTPLTACFRDEIEEGERGGRQCIASLLKAGADPTITIGLRKHVPPVLYEFTLREARLYNHGCF